MEREYPQPGHIGGGLIREILSLWDSFQERRPIDSDILIAVSGGPDSIALAHLLIHYGRRFLLRDRIGLIHVNHGWRGDESDEDARFVLHVAEKWGVKAEVYDFPSNAEKGVSLEENARNQRNRLFEDTGKLVLTAHHGDDLAETVLWRICTGGFKTHRSGILFSFQKQRRPLLSIRKQKLLDYLKEENQSYRTDSSNQQMRFQRNRMRAELLPVLVQIFPKSIEHLMTLGIESQKGNVFSKEESNDLVKTLMEATSKGFRAGQHQELKKFIQSKSSQRELRISGGWSLKPVKSNSSNAKEKWVLERT